MIFEKDDEDKTQARAPEQKEKQYSEKDKNLSDGGGDDRERRLHEVGDVEPKTGIFTLRQDGIAQVLQSRQRPLENLKFFLDDTADLRRLADPIQCRRSQQYDDAVEHNDHKQPQDNRRDQRRDSVGLGPRRQRPQHEADHERGRRRQQHRPPQIEADDEKNDEDADRGDLCGGAPYGRYMRDRRGIVDRQLI